jgi:hypothetical protein
MLSWSQALAIGEHGFSFFRFFRGHFTCGEMNQVVRAAWSKNRRPGKANSSVSGEKPGTEEPR